MNTQYLVTGGLGFIGNELVRQLKRQGTVSVIDNRNRVAPRIEDLADVPLHEIDLTNTAAVRAALLQSRPETVFHLAAIHYIPECNENPERTMRINVEATLGLLRACTAAGVKHLVFASSGAVYADQDGPLAESAPVAPVDIYGWSKLHAEQLCTWHSAMEGLPVTLCRLFNNFGPRETNAHIIPEIINQLRGGDRLMLGNITTRRDYIHTSDTGEALRGLAKIPPPAGQPRIVNVASGNHASVEDIINLMRELTGRPVVVERDPKRFRKADKQVQVADISLLRQLTGFSRQHDLRDGVRDLLKFEGLIR
jgi:UDP-glucose 4-epimerase